MPHEDPTRRQQQHNYNKLNPPPPPDTQPVNVQKKGRDVSWYVDPAEEGTPFADASFATVEDESAVFPSARQLVEGVGIVFTDSGPGTTLEIAATGGPGGSPGDGYWEPLTNGIDDTPELIFCGGDVIMCWRKFPTLPMIP